MGLTQIDSIVAIDALSINAMGIFLIVEAHGFSTFIHFLIKSNLLDNAMVSDQAFSLVFCFHMTFHTMCQIYRSL